MNVHTNQKGSNMKSLLVTLALVASFLGFVPSPAQATPEEVTVTATKLVNNFRGGYLVTLHYENVGSPVVLQSYDCRIGNDKNDCHVGNNPYPVDSGSGDITYQIYSRDSYRAGSWVHIYVDNYPRLVYLPAPTR